MSQSGTLVGFRARIAAFGADRSGLAALEFALIAPMMLILIFVSFELTDALGSIKRSENTAASLADVVSRDVIVTDDEIDDVFAAARWLVFPDPAADVTLRITSIEIDEDGVASVLWSEGRGMAGLGEGAPVSLPAGMRMPETGIVMAEVVMSYRPPLGLFSAEPFEIRKVEYRRPRIIDPVMREA